MAKQGILSVCIDIVVFLLILQLFICHVGFECNLLVQTNRFFKY